jgi:ubiquinone/menaquinone biosynthesis C-methylase UbiE
MSEMFTGERFIPGQGGSQIAVEHLHRYLVASEYVTNKSVLDLGCGAGYGSSLLTKSSSYVGVDVSASSIESAMKTYGPFGAEFLVGDCSNLDIPSHSFDVIVCFEMLEHIDDPESVIREAKRLLKKDGIFISSTPDKVEYNRFLTEPNQYHLHEMTFEEYGQMLRRHFPNNNFMGQHYVQTSIISCLNSDQLSGTIYTTVNNDWLEPLGAPIYWIAMSSEGQLQMSTRSVLPNGQTRDVEGELVKVQKQLEIYEEELKKVQQYFESIKTD